MFLWNIAVTSLVEVWIEITLYPNAPATGAVTSLVEVWIEILTTLIAANSVMSLPLWKCGLKSLISSHKFPVELSLPLWKCGLKLIVFFGNQTDLRHFPCGSVDWNISTGDTYICCIQSLPLWKCGLKWCRHVQYAHDVLSLPLWKCGLKSRWNNQWWRRNTVTSLVEVWIEIFHHNTKGNVWKSHFPCGSVDWNRL